MESTITASHFDENDKVWLVNPEEPDNFLKARIKKVDRLYNTAIVSFEDEVKRDETKVDLSQLLPATEADTYTPLLSSLRVVNNPELLNYFSWMKKNDLHYTSMNQTLFFLNTGKHIQNEIDIEKCKSIIQKDSLDIMEKEPKLSHFLSKLIFNMRNENKNKILFFLGKKGSAKSVHFNFTVDYMEKMFLSKNTALKTKMRCFLSLIKALTNNINHQGVFESFSFGTYKFFFNEKSELENFNYNIINLYITFIGLEKHMSGLPLITYFTKRYFEEKGKTYPHLDEIYEKDLKTNELANIKFKEHYDKVFEAFKVFSFEESFIHMIFKTMLILIDFIHLDINQTISKLKS